jgi:hypothetical protein
MTDIESLFTVATHGAGSEMQIKNAKGIAIDMFITFVGIDSEKWCDIQTEFRAKQAGVIGKGPRELAKVTSQMMAEAAIGWRNVTTKGVEIEFTTEHVYELMLNAPYVRAQADEFIANRINFMRG